MIAIPLYRGSKLAAVVGWAGGLIVEPVAMTPSEYLALTQELETATHRETDPAQLDGVRVDHLPIDGPDSLELAVMRVGALGLRVGWSGTVRF